jgi:hypothetical protein
MPQSLGSSNKHLSLLSCSLSLLSCSLIPCLGFSLAKSNQNQNSEQEVSGAAIRMPALQEQSRMLKEPRRAALLENDLTGPVFRVSTDACWGVSQQDLSEALERKMPCSHTSTRFAFPWGSSVTLRCGGSENHPLRGAEQALSRSSQCSTWTTPTSRVRGEPVWSLSAQSSGGVSNLILWFSGQSPHCQHA